MTPAATSSTSPSSHANNTGSSSRNGASGGNAGSWCLSMFSHSDSSSASSGVSTKSAAVGTAMLLAAHFSTSADRIASGYMRRSLRRKRLTMSYRSRGRPRCAIARIFSANSSWTEKQPRRCREVDARLVGDARQGPEEKRLDVVGAERTAPDHSEVEVLGIAVGLDVALLEAGASLEDPRLRQDRIGTNAPQQPPEDVVLLDDLFGEAPLRDPFDDVGA